MNVMTSGAGIAHAEQTPRDNTGRLDGVQLWTALPDRYRHLTAGFASLKEVPTIERSHGIVQIFAGELEGAASPAPYYSALLGADVQVYPRHERRCRSTPPTSTRSSDGRRLRAEPGTARTAHARLPRHDALGRPRISARAAVERR